MKQLEIEFWWPLTQQIPLALDYTGCEKPRLTTNYLSGSVINTQGTGWVSPIHLGTISPSLSTEGPVTMNVDAITFRTRHKPSIVRKLMFKLLGINLESIT